jgi:tetratricopeptide (TPR) repeat protein/predicted Ser/Thr protein kinase
LDRFLTDAHSLRLSPRLDEAVAEYYRQREKGITFRREAFLNEYADVAAELESFLDTVREVDRCTVVEDKTVAANVGEITGNNPPWLDGQTTFVGDYELLNEIGRGAMGIVYKARQRSLDRVVAVKMILTGASATSEEVRRLQNEAKLAAKLRHPRIVPIHEVSEAQGRHFFSMDFVDGVSLAKRLRENPVPHKQAAEYLAQIAEAVHFAHENGILHRDLKPANILLDQHGQPHVTDFGLARQLKAENALTESGAILGTASYMAPEQASGQTSTLTAAADVYSLGAILYEMLTGRPPFKATTAWETLMLARSEDPVSIRSLEPEVPRDLETICLECLQKQPQKRFSSAEELASDLRRFLKGEPIKTRPIGNVERLGRWCGRNRMLASSIVGIFTLLLLLAVGSGIAALVIVGQRNDARAARSAEALAKNEAERRLQDTIEAVNIYCTEVSESSELKAYGLEALRKKLLEAALQFYEGFVREKGGEIGLEFERGRAYQRLGDLFHTLGHDDQAESSFRSALSIFESLTEQSPQQIQYQLMAGEVMGRLATLYQETGRRALAEANYRGAITALERLAKTRPEEPSVPYQLADLLNQLGVCYLDANEFSSAEETHKQGIQICSVLTDMEPQNPKYLQLLADHHHNLGQLYGKSGRKESAVAHSSADLEIGKRLASIYPDVPEYQRGLAITYENWGNAFRGQQRDDLAEQYLVESRMIRQRLAETHPDVPRYQRDVGHSQMNLGDFWNAIGRHDLAELADRQACAIFERLSDAHPEVIEYVIFLGGSLCNTANVLRDSGKMQQALECYEASIQRLQTVLRQKTQATWVRDFLIEARAGRATVLSALGRHPEALREFDLLLDDPAMSDRVDLRLGRMLSRAKKGDYAQATDEANLLLKQTSLTTPNLYDLSCVYSLSSEVVLNDVHLPAIERDGRSEQYASLAVQLLTRAYEEGLFENQAKRRLLQTDEKLRALRPRREFNRLLNAWNGPRTQHAKD